MLLQVQLNKYNTDLQCFTVTSVLLHCNVYSKYLESVHVLRSVPVSSVIHCTPSPWLRLLLVLGKIRVNQVLFIKNQVKAALVKEFLFHSTCYVRNGNFLKSHVSEICVKGIHVNQEVGVYICSVEL